jgi:hypothetical protein
MIQEVKGATKFALGMWILHGYEYDMKRFSCFARRRSDRAWYVHSDTHKAKRCIAGFKSHVAAVLVGC